MISATANSHSQRPIFTLLRSPRTTALKAAATEKQPGKKQAKMTFLGNRFIPRAKQLGRFQDKRTST
jgi:hypothetical protein